MCAICRSRDQKRRSRDQRVDYMTSAISWSREQWEVCDDAICKRKYFTSVLVMLSKSSPTSCTTTCEFRCRDSFKNDSSRCCAVTIP